MKAWTCEQIRNPLARAFSGPVLHHATSCGGTALHACAQRAECTDRKAASQSDASTHDALPVLLRHVFYGLLLLGAFDCCLALLVCSSSGCALEQQSVCVSHAHSVALQHLCCCIPGSRVRLDARWPFDCRSRRRGRESKLPLHCLHTHTRAHGSPGCWVRMSVRISMSHELQPMS